MNKRLNDVKAAILAPSGSAVQVTMMVLLVVGAFLLGSLWQKVQFLEKGGPVAQAQNTGGAQQQAQAQPPAQPTVTIDQIKAAFNKSFIKFGDTNKKLVAIEIADPSCPYCHVAAGRNPELNKQIGGQFQLVTDGGAYIAPVPELEKLAKDGKIAFAYVYAPGHGNGEMGVKALYCANEKGKFWEVHDYLMTNKGYDLLNNTVRNDKTKSQELADFFKPVFDAGAMKQCLDSGKYDTRPGEETSLASSIGVNATPGFFLNSTLFAGAYSYKDMEPAVKAAGI